jgi:hypothetical protein
LKYSVFAFLSIFSASPVPRSACRGPCAAAAALFAAVCATFAAWVMTFGAPSGTAVVSALPPSSLIRRLSWREWSFVSFRCSLSRFLYGARVVIWMWACSAVSSCCSLP